MRNMLFVVCHLLLFQIQSYISLANECMSVMNYYTRHAVVRAIHAATTF